MFSEYIKTKTITQLDIKKYIIANNDLSLSIKSKSLSGMNESL